MACKGSRLGSALPCPAGRSVPGRGGPERRRRPRPDGIGQPAGPCWVRMTTGTPGSRRARAVTTGRLNPQVNAPWRRRPGTPEEADGGFESHLLRPCSGTVCARQSGCRLVSEGAGGPDVPGLALGDGHPPAGRPLSPGSSWTSPGQTAKFWTTTTCGRGSSPPVSSWLELWVQPASSASTPNAIGCLP